MDNAIYQLADCNEKRDGAPVPYPELSQIADFSGSAGEKPDYCKPPEARTMRFYPGVLESKYMQAVVRGGREGLLQFKENPKPGYPVPYPWPEWFDHERCRPSAGTGACGQPINAGYPQGCVAQQPAPIPAGGQSLCDPSQVAAIQAAQLATAEAAQREQVAAQQRAACELEASQQACPPQCRPPSPCPTVKSVCASQCGAPAACPPAACVPPAGVRKPQPVDGTGCIPCVAAAPEVYQHPVVPNANCTPCVPAPPPQCNTLGQRRCRPTPQSSATNFVPSYLHDPENMAKIIAHDYQRQWVCERDVWENCNSGSVAAQRDSMLTRCQQGERK